MSGLLYPELWNSATLLCGLKSSLILNALFCCEKIPLYSFYYMSSDNSGVSCSFIIWYPSVCPLVDIYAHICLARVRAIPMFSKLSANFPKWFLSDSNFTSIVEFLLLTFLLNLVLSRAFHLNHLRGWVVVIFKFPFPWLLIKLKIFSHLLAILMSSFEKQTTRSFAHVPLCWSVGVPLHSR